MGTGSHSVSRSQAVLAGQGPDHPDQLVRFMGLAEEEPALGHILVSNARKAGCQHKLDRLCVPKMGFGVDAGNRPRSITA